MHVLLAEDDMKLGKLIKYMLGRMAFLPSGLLLAI